MIINDESEKLIKEIFGKTLKEIRRSKDISQEKLYLSSSVDRKFIHQIEHGKQQPSLITIIKIVKALNMTFPEFFEIFESKLKKGLVII